MEPLQATSVTRIRQDSPEQASSKPCWFATQEGVELPLDVDGVLLDIDDFVYDSSTDWRWLVQLLCRMGLQTHFVPFYAIWQRDYLPCVNRGQEDYWGAFSRLLKDVGMSRAAVEEVRVAWQPRRLPFVNCSRPLPGVAAMLARLSKLQLPVGAISNTPGPAEVLRQRLRAIHLERWVSSVTTAGSIRCSAPDRYLYEHAAQQLASHPTRLVFVGHNWLEITGAADSGMRTICCWNDPNSGQADIYLQRLDVLPELIVRGQVSRLAG
ncbi:MAG: HAD family hydrolase [Pirellulaceae bacterium]|nr:HAD family hydrolase [Planctomycetales bacterium]